jgi:hypothetical protein
MVNSHQKPLQCCSFFHIVANLIYNYSLRNAEFTPGNSKPITCPKAKNDENNLDNMNCTE